MKKKVIVFLVVSMLCLLPFLGVSALAATEGTEEAVSITTQAADFANKWLPAIITAGFGTVGSFAGLLILIWKVKKYKFTLDTSTGEGKKKYDEARAKLEEQTKAFKEQANTLKDLVMEQKETICNMAKQLEKSENSKKELVLLLCECVGMIPQFVANGTAQKIAECTNVAVEDIKKSIENIQKLEQNQEQEKEGE